jgi:hypothetical protein
MPHVALLTKNARAVGTNADRIPRPRMSDQVSQPRRLARQLATRRALLDRQREWLQKIIELTGHKPSQIALRSHVSDTTLTRFLNNPAHAHSLSQTTIDQIKLAYGIPGPEEFAGRGVMLGLYEADEINDLSHVAQGLPANGSNSRRAWRLKTEALAAVGYLPGDILIVDINVTALPHDVVAISQVMEHGNPVIKFRVFNPPYLMAAPLERVTLKPMLLDNERITMIGPVVESYRPHRLSAIR